ncbi:MAG: hypothetical protein LBC02_08840 [Planctomycetaceae bacterium]|jgi:hypothetical protein|nr:hypothetical protein [Planctomycetaceae bacterium]
MLSTAYKKNRDSFTNINCKFKFIWKAKADSIQQAIDHKYEITPNTVLHDGKLISKNGDTYFERICSQEDKIKNENILKEAFNQQKDNSIIINGKKVVLVKARCHDVILLVSKDLYRLTYSESGRVANIIPSGVEEGGVGIEFSPFDMGVMARNEYSNPHRYLQDCIRGRFSGKYEGIQEINGQQLEVVTFSTKDSNNQPSMKFGFDPKKGFLATYIADYDSKTHALRYEAFITETKHCSGDRYFPMRSVIVMPENESYRINDGKYYVNSIEVTELDVDTPPNSKLLQLEIAKDCEISVPSFKNQWMKAEKTISVTPKEIKKLHKKCIAYGKAYLEQHQTPPLSNFTEPNLKRGMWIKTILIVVGLILIMIGGLRILRRKK